MSLVCKIMLFIEVTLSECIVVCVNQSKSVVVCDKGHVAIVGNPK